MRSRGRWIPFCPHWSASPLTNERAPLAAPHLHHPLRRSARTLTNRKNAVRGPRAENALRTPPLCMRAVVRVVGCAKLRRRQISKRKQVQRLNKRLKRRKRQKKLQKSHRVQLKNRGNVLPRRSESVWPRSRDSVLRRRSESVWPRRRSESVWPRSRDSVLRRRSESVWPR